VKILLDENISPRFGSLLIGHEVSAIAGSDLRSISDKEMLSVANQRFDALVTMDKGLIHQQNLKDNLLIIVLMRGPNNRYERWPRWHRKCFSS
jgi:predicted nuclease of predicted toxin-antitoxin system